MKKLLLLSFLVSSISMLAQVGINTTTPAAQLEIKSTNQATPANTDGLLIPKIDTFPATNPTVAQQGMMVNLTIATIFAGNPKPAGFYYWDNTTTNWIPFAGTSTTGWTTTGNAGTNPTTNFIGTTDNNDLVFKRNNINAGILGSSNTAFGVISLLSNTTGAGNTANGFASLYSNTTGEGNIANGIYSLYLNTSGDYNTACGSYSLFANETGGNNTAIGYKSLLNNSSGIRNCAIGSNALKINTIGNFNTAIGGYADFTSNNLSNSVVIGDAASVTASNQIRMGDGSVSSIGGFANWTNVSDKRFKKDIQPNVPGLAFIKKLQPVTYHLDMDAIAGLLKTPDSLRKKDSEALKGKMLQTGFIAQEVEAAAKELHYDFSGVDAPKNDNDFYGLRYAEFVVPLVKAVQEQQEIIEVQNNEIRDLQTKNLKIEQQNQQTSKELQQLKTQNTSLELRLKAIEAVISK
jgi:trimeric autotransporter adhesin